MKNLTPDAGVTELATRLEKVVEAIKTAETPGIAARLAQQAEKIEDTLRRRENVLLTKAGFKRCSKCLEVKECAPREKRSPYKHQRHKGPRLGFYRDSKRRGGWSSWCKQCMKESTDAARIRRRAGKTPAWKHRTKEERELDQLEKFMNAVRPKVPVELLIQPDHLWCKDCQQTLLASEFPPDKRTTTGKKGRCKGCHEKWNARKKLEEA
jgi:hypothetical protein